MSKSIFPDPRIHHFAEVAQFGGFYYPASDIIALGTKLNVANISEAYRKGIFPWHIEGMPLPWFCPEWRAILRFADLHIPKSLRKAGRKANYSFTIDRAFERVIRSCAEATRTGETGTWITDEFIEVYTEVHELGMAHSVEVWNENEELIGGLYGVDAGGVFCGESMFFLEPNASKLALLFLIEHLKESGCTWLDIQVMTPHMEILGATEIARRKFLKMLRYEQNLGCVIF